MLRAFTQPFADVRVLIVGQDPYPTPGHPIGLSFSVAPDVRPIPRSLQNIYRELRSDLDVSVPATGDLSPWAAHGVLLLNRVLTVTPGRARIAPRPRLGGGHRPGDPGPGRPRHAAGRDLVGTGRAEPAAVPGSVPCIESVHPSPMSADRGFFGSRPFSRANELLVAQGADPIDWALPEPAVKRRDADVGPRSA